MKRVPVVATLIFVLFSSLASGRAEELPVGVAFLGDLKYSNDFEHFDYVNPDAPKGGSLSLPTMSGFVTLLPFKILGAPGIARLYDTLIIRASDEVASYYGRLAEGILLTHDARSLKVRLRPQARWHDGTTITSQDVKYTYDAVLAIPGGAMVLHWVSSIEIVDEHELIIHASSEITASNIDYLSNLSILPRLFWSGKENNEVMSSVIPLGSGPYRIAEVDLGKMIRYERVPDYWGRDIPVNRGWFNFDTIQYDVYRDATVAREAMRKGIFDIWLENEPRYRATAFNIPARDSGWLITGTANWRFKSGARTALFFNNQRAPFTDPQVREALTYAFDFEWQNRTFYFNERARADSYFNKSVCAPQNLPDEAEIALLEPFREQLPERVFTEVFKYPRSNGVGDNREGLVRAFRLLKEAGWHLDGDTLYDSEGAPFELEFMSRSLEDHRVLLPYINSLAQLGIKANIRSVESTQYASRLGKREYDALIRFQYLGFPPSVLHWFFHSESAFGASTGNHASIMSPVVDAMLEAISTATSISEVTSACRALDRVLLWGFHAILLDTVEDQYLFYWNKFGRPEGGQAEDVLLSPYPDAWWLDKQKADRIPQHN